MNILNTTPLALAFIYLWIGFVCAISFMEAWLKFRAPGITVPVALGIGRLVFQALNKVEWILACLIIASLLVSDKLFFSADHAAFFVVLILLLLQTVWLLPRLDARAKKQIKGLDAAPSRLHYYYIAMEVVKVPGLLIFSTNLF